MPFPVIAAVAARVGGMAAARGAAGAAGGGASGGTASALGRQVLQQAAVSKVVNHGGPNGQQQVGPDGNPEIDPAAATRTASASYSTLLQPGQFH